MSAYGKPQPSQNHGYETGRPYSEAQYSYTTPAYSSTNQSPIPTSAAYHNAPLTPMAYSTHQTRPSYEDQTGPYLNVGSAPTPQVTSYSPARGTRDTQLCVYITSLYELVTSNTPLFFLMFGQRKFQANLQKLNQQGTVCNYTVTADVPHFSATNWQSSQVPISMFMESQDGDVMAKVEVGEFTYLDSGIRSAENTPQGVSKKRKLSTDSTDLMRSPLKRTASQQLRPKDEYGGYGYSQSEAAFSSSPYLQTSSSYPNIANQYNRGVYQGVNASRHLSYGYSSSATASPPTIKAQPQSPQVGQWNSGYPNIGPSMARSPGIPSNVCMSRPTISSLPAPPVSIAANPPLIRTSTITASSPASAHHGPGGGAYSAYAMYPSKAMLEIKGNLESMAQNWSDEECEARRRLVHFTRSQSGSTITASFQAVSADEKPQNSICISCIYWEEKRECFVTSVDTIFLLEKLVDARFTVEEKNRIRRNLEGFRPLTVSKGKEESEEFFKVIMAFPAPKPRNIEKDVKVFCWKDLASALKKIIGKYSASPSSTLPPTNLLTPVSSTGYAAESYNADHHGTMSPRSIAGSTSSTAYAAATMPVRGLSPHNQKLMGLQGPPDLRAALPHEPPSHWQGVPHHMQSSQHFQQLTHPNARSSWEMPNYLESSPATSTGNSTPQNVNYQGSRSVTDTAVPGTSGDNRMTSSLSSQQQQQQQQSQQVSRS